MKKIISLMLIMLFCCHQLLAQIDPLLLKINSSDSIGLHMNMDAVYNRPFTHFQKLPVSLGGYLETNWQYAGTDAVSEGHQFQFRRMTLFVSSSISKRLKFLSEIEFEDGGKEIAIEFAAMDLEILPLLNLRGGIILNPIAAFNQNHDGPKWEFTDRPISATQLLPATWSNAGFGIYGKKYMGNWMLGYEAYASGNFDNSIIDNPENKTFLAAAKNNPERFETINSGLPLFTGKIAIKHNQLGEIGISYMGGIFNKFESDGLMIDEKRKAQVFAIDFNRKIPTLKTILTGEFCWIWVDVPETYSQQYGNKQYGGFVDLVQPIVEKSILGWPEATVNLALRLEYVDWNVGKFKDTGEDIHEDIWRITPAISFRPVNQTVLRLNYSFQQQQDILGNPTQKTGIISVGLATYF